jgi:hypothetical protein
VGVTFDTGHGLATLKTTTTRSKPEGDSQDPTANSAWRVAKSPHESCPSVAKRERRMLPL